MKKLSFLALILLAVLTAPACSVVHIVHWDHIPNGGWRSHLAGNICNYYVFDDDGEVLPASSGCFDLDKNPLPGCVPGHWNVSPQKAAIDAKILARRTEDHCRLTAYGCRCTGLAYPWTDAQKKLYPSCDPSKAAVAASAK